MSIGIDSNCIETARLEFAGEMLRARLEELAARPHPDKCDLLIRDLHAACHLVAQLRDQLMRQASANR